MAHAVDSLTSGAVPLLARDTAPSERRQPELPAPTAPSFRRQGGAAVEDALTPPREVRSTDITKLSIPMPFMLTLIGLVVAIVIFVLQIKSDVRLMDANQQHQKESTQYQFDEIKALISAAGLRNANMSLSQEMVKLQNENIQLREQLKQQGR